MLALAAAQMSYKVAILDDDPNCPAAQVSAFHFPLNMHDEFSRISDIVTYEFEHIDISTAEKIEGQALLRPDSKILKTKKSRASEKTFLKEKGFPVVDFQIAHGKTDLLSTVSKMKLPLVVKTTLGGYDGKGQFYIKDKDDTAQLRNAALPDQQFVIEEMIDYEKELSVIIARKASGDTSQFPVVENIHKNGILHTTTFPAHIDRHTELVIKELAASLSIQLGLEGLLAIELFLTKDGKILINEIAPRPHNSGHYTMNACVTSQFEQLIRAICGLPFGSVKMLPAAGMLNLIGISTEQLDIGSILSIPGAHLHLYGKTEVRAGRKMGHINVTGETESETEQKLQTVEKIVYQRGCPNSSGDTKTASKIRKEQL